MVKAASDLAFVIGFIRFAASHHSTDGLASKPPLDVGIYGGKGSS